MLLKSCRCGKLIPQSMKMCEECEQRQQSRHMIYNNTRRDERAAEFYVSKEWRAMRERIIEVYDNIDIYALYALQIGLENTIVFETRACDKMEEIRLNLKEFYAVYKGVEFKIYDACPMFTDDRKYQLKCRAGA